MIICICHRVSDRDIARAVRHGCSSFDELQGELSVATACGACHDCARQTFEQHAGACSSLGGAPGSFAASPFAASPFAPSAVAPSPVGNSPLANNPAAAAAVHPVHMLHRTPAQARAAG